MKAWKQLVLALGLLLAAGAAWVMFFPGADTVLARWGVDSGQTASSNPGQRPAGGQRNRGQQAAVVTRAVQQATINDKLSAIGTGRALNSVTVIPEAPGRLTQIAVASGRHIAAGDVLARLESETEEIALERAKIALADAQAKVDRVKALRTSNTATTVQLTDAELALSNASLALRDAELDLKRRTIVSPISGIVGILPVEIGNYVTTQTPVATIDDRSQITVDFWVPERYASMIAVGDPLTAEPIARPGKLLQGSVSAVDNRLDELSRTLRVQARIANDTDALRAGMSFQVALRFPGDTYPAVDPLAIQWSTDGAFIWSISEGRAKRIPVRVVQRNTDSVLVEAPIAAGDLVVTEGIHTVREGAELLIAGSEDKPKVVPSGS